MISIGVSPDEIPSDGGSSTAVVSVTVVNSGGRPVNNADVTIEITEGDGIFKDKEGNKVTSISLKTNNMGVASTKYYSGDNGMGVNFRGSYIKSEKERYVAEGRLVQYDVEFINLVKYYGKGQGDWNIRYKITPKFTADKGTIKIYDKDVEKVSIDLTALNEGEHTVTISKDKLEGLEEKEYMMKIRINKGDKYDEDVSSFTLFSVELQDTEKAYRKIGESINLTAILKPLGLTGGSYSWALKSYSSGKGNFIGTNPATFVGSQEGCVYPEVSYTINGAKSTSKKDKRILVYYDPGPNTPVTPTIGEPTITHNPGKGEVTPSSTVPSLGWNAYFSPSDKRWYVRVSSFNWEGGIINIPYWTGKEPNPEVGGNVFESNYKEIISDLSDYDQPLPIGGAGPVWHLTSATEAHEMHHWNQHWKVECVQFYWSTYESKLEELSIEEGNYCKRSDAEAQLESAVITVAGEYQLKVRERWAILGSSKFTDNPGMGNTAWAAGQAVLNEMIDKIKELAKNPDRNISTDDAWGKPINLTAEKITEPVLGVKLTWVDDCIVENGFVVERMIIEPSAKWIQLATLAENTTSYTDNTVTTGKTYYYRVKATTSINSTPYSVSVSITP